MTTEVSKQKSGFKHLDFVVLDLMCAYVAYIIAYFVRFPAMLGVGFHFRYPEFMVSYAIVQIAVSFILRYHSKILRRGMLDELISVVLLCGFTMAGTIFVLYSFHIVDKIPRLMLYIMESILVPMMFIERVLWKEIVIKYFIKGRNYGLALLVITDSANADDLVEKINSEVVSRYRVVGVSLVDGVKGDEIQGVPVVSDLEGATHYICHNWVDNVLVHLPKGETIPNNFYSTCSEMNITVHSVLSIDDVENKRISVSMIGGRKVLTTGYVGITFNQMIIKRTMDILGGIVGCIFALLVILFVGPIIYIQSPGPIIFKQIRIGKNGKKFNFYKLRSMCLNADEIKKQYEAQNKSKDGFMFKMDFDPRIIGNRILPDGRKKTGIGQFIRKTSLDEFPQFFNVLKGDMSLVGTRPPTLDEWEKYDYHHRARLTMQPGITGLWQTSGRSNIMDFEEVVKLDTKYIANFSIRGDIKILGKTVLGMLKRDGAV